MGAGMSEAPALPVYFFAAEGQPRQIIAAGNAEEAARAFGVTPEQFFALGGLTDNALEIKVASTYPHEILTAIAGQPHAWEILRALDAHDGSAPDRVRLPPRPRPASQNRRRYRPGELAK